MAKRQPSKPELKSITPNIRIPSDDTVYSSRTTPICRKPIFRDRNGGYRFYPSPLEKQVGKRGYSLDASSTRPEICKPLRNGFERLRNGIGTSKHLDQRPPRLNLAGPAKFALPLRDSGHKVCVGGPTSTSQVDRANWSTHIRENWPPYP